jgi:hypothetical protein
LVTRRRDEARIVVETEMACFRAEHADKRSEDGR